MSVPGGGEIVGRALNLSRSGLAVLVHSCPPAGGVSVEAVEMRVNYALQLGPTLWRLGLSFAEASPAARALRDRLWHASSLWRRATVELFQGIIAPKRAELERRLCGALGLRPEDAAEAFSQHKIGFYRGWTERLESYAVVTGGAAGVAVRFDPAGAERLFWTGMVFEARALRTAVKRRQQNQQRFQTHRGLRERALHEQDPERARALRAASARDAAAAEHLARWLSHHCDTDRLPPWLLWYVWTWRQDDLTPQEIEAALLARYGEQVGAREVSKRLHTARRFAEEKGFFKLLAALYRDDGGRADAQLEATFKTFVLSRGEETLALDDWLVVFRLAHLDTPSVNDQSPLYLNIRDALCEQQIELERLRRYSIKMLKDFTGDATFPEGRTR